MNTEFCYPEFGTGLIVSGDTCEYMIEKMYKKYIEKRKLNEKDFSLQDFTDRRLYIGMLDNLQASYYDSSSSSPVQVSYFKRPYDTDIVASPTILCWAERSSEPFKQAYSSPAEMASELSAKFSEYLPKNYNFEKHLGSLKTVIF